jgi:Uma2 family endonuclease
LKELVALFGLFLMSSMPVAKPRSAVPASSEVKPVDCKIAVAGQEFVLPASAHTLDGFRAWAKSEQYPERGRICFLDGEIFIDMSPEELETHVAVKWEVGSVVHFLNKKTKRGQFYGDGSQVSNVDANLSTIPDGTFILWESLDAGRVRLVPWEGEEGAYMEIEGTPDWMLEVVSKYSVQKDTKQLRQKYHRAGIPEYWLIDAWKGEIRFQILLRGDTDYMPAEVKKGWQESPVFGYLFRLMRQRNSRGFWNYTLEVKQLPRRKKGR